MARPVPIRFLDKVRLVQAAVSTARGSERRLFDFTRDVAPGVRLVLADLDDVPLAFSLWTLPQDIAHLCGDAAYPATAALLAVDGEQAREVIAGGHLVDLGQFTSSESTPGLYYVLVDHASPRQLQGVLHRLVPALQPRSAAA
jgi:hypothetical protein